MLQMNRCHVAKDLDDNLSFRDHFRGLILRMISARLVYGAVVILSTLPAIDSTKVDVATQSGTVLLATFAVVFAELYSDIVGTMIQERRRRTHSELVTMTTQLSSSALAAVPPLALTLPAWAGVMSVQAAGSVSAWLLIGVVFAFGFAAARAAGASIVGSALDAARIKPSPRPLCVPNACRLVSGRSGVRVPSSASTKPPRKTGGFGST